MPGAAHTACTVEMVNMQRRVDVAVIDEIQMIGDESRCAGRGRGATTASWRSCRQPACSPLPLMLPLTSRLVARLAGAGPGHGH